MKKKKLIRRDLLDKAISQRNLSEHNFSYKQLDLDEQFILVDGPTETYRFRLGLCELPEIVISSDPNNTDFPTFLLSARQYFECLRGKKSLEIYHAGYIDV
jgi:hypothetical protein